MNRWNLCTLKGQKQLGLIMEIKEMINVRAVDSPS
jgi:hypothetical protein